MILRFGLQTSLCNLCREVYNETKAEGFLSVFAVALLAEGVDRNAAGAALAACSLVALLAEGVDRNIVVLVAQPDLEVALLAEGVDRNHLSGLLICSLPASPSSRRAWIEILEEMREERFRSVALLAEGVDRNKLHEIIFTGRQGRPPRGGRG